jgi:hypothetical protein
MKTDDVLDARRKFTAELHHQARSQHGREFAELPTATGAKLVRFVRDRHPEWEAALDDDVRPTVTAADWSVAELRADATPTREQRERDAARAYGFSEDQVRHDPLRADMCQTAAMFAERDAARADVEAAVLAVANELHVDPRTHAGRCTVFAELVKRRHPLATTRRFERLT